MNKIQFEKDEDKHLASLLNGHDICSPSFDITNIQDLQGVEAAWIFRPTEEFSFLHEAAIIAYHGTLFASWYNCPEKELEGRTVIRGTKSQDFGQTWSEVEILAEDTTGEILYCPPVYGICDDKLYIFVNQMVKADHIHSLDLYEYSDIDEKFHLLWSRPIPFKLNTNVYEFGNGKLLLAGRVGELDQFPDTPAVLISDSGKIDAEWRLIKLQKDRFLPDGSKLIHPETSAIISGNECTIFCRNDERSVPLIYKSTDCGDSWEGPASHNIHFSNSKIYSGTLSDGRHYVIGNLHPGRDRLAILFTKPNETVFSSGGYICNGPNIELEAAPQWSYPVATEWGDHLYVIHTATTSGEKRGAMLSIVPL